MTHHISSLVTPPQPATEFFLPSFPPSLRRNPSIPLACPLCSSFPHSTHSLIHIHSCTQSLMQHMHSFIGSCISRSPSLLSVSVLFVRSEAAGCSGIRALEKRPSMPVLAFVHLTMRSRGIYLIQIVKSLQHVASLAPARPFKLKHRRARTRRAKELLLHVCALSALSPLFQHNMFS